MTSLDFRIVDVFTDRPLAGNQLAVVLKSEGRASDTTTFELGVGPVPVTIGARRAWMTQPQPTFNAPAATAAMIAKALGIEEDPATGGAAGPLGAYLALHAYPGEAVCRFTFEQGYEMGRPSVIEVEIERQGETFTAVRVGGAAVVIARGVMELP